MAIPTYRIRGPQVERENVPQEWLERVRPELGVRREQPSLQALRNVAAYDPSEEYDPSILEDAKRTLEETYATQAQLNAPSLTAGEPEGWLSRAARGVGRGLGNLLEQPFVQASGTPAGTVMSAALAGPIQAARHAAQYGPAMARAFGPRSAQTIRHAASRPDLAGLRSATVPPALGQEAITDPRRLLPALGEATETGTALGQGRLRRPEQTTLQLVQELLQQKTPSARVTRLSKFPKPPGSGELERAIRQRAHISESMTERLRAR